MGTMNNTITISKSDLESLDLDLEDPGEERIVCTKLSPACLVHCRVMTVCWRILDCISQRFLQLLLGFFFFFLNDTLTCV